MNELILPFFFALSHYAAILLPISCIWIVCGRVGFAKSGFWFNAWLPICLACISFVSMLLGKIGLHV